MSPALEDVRLEGQHVILRPIRPEDVELAFAQVHHRREILEWLIWEGPETPEDMRAFYTDWCAGDAEGYDYHFALVGREDGRFSGSLGARFAGHPHSGDLGYWIAADRWGRGYASEAIFLSSWLCFEHLGAALLYANVFVGNAASRRALEKSGFELAHVSRPVFAGAVREQWHMTLTRSRFQREHAGRRPQSAEVVVSGTR